MTIQQAVKKAIEGGWIQSEPCLIEGLKLYHTGDTLLDPLFWEALGKAMEWKTEIHQGCRHPMLHQCYWHNFIDYLAKGKSIESFFESI